MMVSGVGIWLQRMPSNKYRRKDGIIITNEITDTGKISGTRDSHGLKVSPYRLLNSKRKKGTFTMERSDGHHLHQVIKISITNNRTSRYYVPPDDAMENIQLHLRNTLLNMFNLNL